MMQNITHLKIYDKRIIKLKIQTRKKSNSVQARDFLQQYIIMNLLMISSETFGIMNITNDVTRTTKPAERCSS